MATSADLASRGRTRSATSRLFNDALNDMDDRRIADIKPLIPPQILVEDLPLSKEAALTVFEGRNHAEAIIKGEDDRLLVVVGPCSIHDTKAALEYAALLKKYAEDSAEDLHIVMRVYFEKPRTTVGWKGLINDPQLNGTFQINKGLRVARGLLLQINELGLPTGSEFLDTLTPQYIGDLISWGAIGARTTESQVHRELASGISAPIGFKNGTDGNIGIAIDAIRAASSGHHFLSVTKQGISAIVSTTGNDSCHIILRGGNAGPNYDATNVLRCASQLQSAKLGAHLMIDCSHGNSSKQFKRQLDVANSIAEQLSSVNSSASNIVGVMIESHLVEGRQNIPEEGPSGLVYGQSITDACLSWTDTVVALERLREGVRARRSNRAAAADYAAVEATSVVDEL
ncbi:3-deoxy-7-phosphoheptulonate synthase [Polychytrium aggregatum]|uniref:3-deoxy-7-phosphoheptulonate synthase n=1 Tax=Polychytrium aggregatum TaxID=110093 RepID=UPI0022FE98BE|nr:3-deoxy-7-phosphoheptulonate synthase [Polychytrium aggregatum]KAI9208718.1 3-deoxy-7-phosphoheptulonate synthase [Polychytrium aggregatum]